MTRLRSKYPSRYGLGIVVASVLVAWTAGPAHAQSAQDAAARAASARLAGFARFAKAAMRDASDGQIEVTVGSPDVVATLFSADGQWFGAITHKQPARFTASVLAPGLDPVVGDVTFKHVVVVVSDKVADVPVARVPAALALAPYAVSGAVHLEVGVNVFTSATLGTSGLLGRVRAGLGLGAEPIRIHGAAGARVADALMEGTTAKVQPEAVALTVTFPSFTPEPFRALADKTTVAVTVESLTLSVRSSATAFDVAGAHSTKVTIAGATATVTGTLAVTRTGSAAAPVYDAAMTGRVDIGGRAPQLAGLTLKAVGVEGQFTSATRGIALGLVTDVLLPNKQVITGKVALKIDGRTKRLEEISVGLVGSFSLADLRLAVPGAKDFVFTDPMLGMRVATREAFVGGTLAWKARKLEASAVAFVRGGRTPAVAVFARLRATSLRSLVPALPAVADLPLPEAVMVISSAKLTDVPVAQLPSPAQEMLGQIAIAANGKVTASDGVTVLTRLGGPLADVATKLGISGPVVLAGAIGGVFSGSPSFSLYAELPAFKLPKEMGSSFLALKSVKPRMFVTLGKGDLGPQLDLGLELEAAVRFGRQEPVFAGKVFTSLGAKGASFNFTGLLKGEWRDPFGLTGIAFRDVVVGLGLGASASADIALSGNVMLGKLSYSMSGMTTLQVSPALGIPVPRALGIQLKGNELSFATPFKIGDALVGAVTKGALADAIADAKLKAALAQVAKVNMTQLVSGALPIDALQLRDFELYFATPGASHPDIPALDGMGVRIAGKLYLNGKLLGATAGALKVPEGFSLDAAIASFGLGPLALDKAKLSMAMPVPGFGKGAPHLSISGKGGVKPLDMALDVQLDKTQARFSGALALGPLGAATLSASSIGPLHAPTDFSLSVSAQSDFSGKFGKQLAGAIKGFLAKSKTAKNAAAADKLVVERKKAYDKVHDETERDYKKAQDNLETAKKNLAKIDKDISAARARIKVLKKKDKDAFPMDPKRAGYASEIAFLATKIGTLTASRKVAEGVLEATKKLVGVSVNVNPKVVAAGTALAAAQTSATTLHVALAAENATKAIAEELAKGVVKSFAIDKLEVLDARLRGVLQGAKTKLRIAMRFKNKRIDYTFQVDLLSPWKLAFDNLPERIVELFKS